MQRGRRAATKETARLRNRQRSARDRMALLGEIAAGMVHDLGNLLGGMRHRIAALEKSAPRVPAVAAHARELERAVDHLQEIVDRARRVAKPSSTESLDLRRLAEDVAELARLSLRGPGARYTLVVEGEPVPPVPAPASELFQVVMNLVLNARDAMSDGGEIHISLEADAARVSLSVRDRGPGFPPDVLPRVFDRFFTTKPHGMGLGLSLARSLMSALGGRVTAANHPGGGAIVRLELPRESPRRRRPRVNASSTK